MMNPETIQKTAHEKRRIKKINEILDLLQEECGEVVQMVSKARRFGLDEKREDLVKEIADVSLLIELLHSYQLFTHDELNQAKLNKSKKLVKWSTIYDERNQ
jgi:NTP pyrophosphatase (non-canonical NTP hydrolase)